MDPLGALVLVNCVDVYDDVVVKGLAELMTSITDAFDLSSANEITFKKHMIPEANAQYDFGTAERKVRHLFLSDS